jgi:hypothetical protein
MWPKISPDQNTSQAVVLQRTRAWQNATEQANEKQDN